jgi:hypothetical protein
LTISHGGEVLRYLILDLIHCGVSLIELVHTYIQEAGTQLPANVSGKIDTGSLIFVPHVPGAFYETFTPEKAKALWDRFEFVFTPKHGSWLNMAEIELNVLTSQCLNRRIDNIEEVRNEAEAWQNFRNNKNAKVNWQFDLHRSYLALFGMFNECRLYLGCELWPLFTLT